MRPLTFLFLLLFQPLHAEEFVIQGGASPDGRYSILLVQDARPPDPESGQGGFKAFFRNNETKSMQPLSVGPQFFCSFKGAQEPVNSQAWWNSDGSLVALCFRTTRHSREPYVYSIRKGGIHRVPLPDYDAVIYGRLGVKPFNGHYVRCPTEWVDDRTLKLFSWGDMNGCNITLRIQNKGGHVPKASIVEITKGDPLEG